VSQRKSYVLQLFDLNKRQEIRRFEGLTDYSCDAVLSPDGRLLAANSMDGKLLIWDVANGKELRRWENLSTPTFACATGFSPDGKLLALSYNSQIRIFGLR